MLQKNNLPNKSKKVLLDTSAIIALLKKEPGYEILDDIIANSAISIVNLSELVGVLARSGITTDEIDKMITDIIPEIIPFTEEIAIHTGKLIKLTKDYGLSLGDRACIATGIHQNMVIYSTDTIWKELKTSADIIIIR